MTEATHLAMDLSGLKLKLVQLAEPRMGKSRDFDAPTGMPLRQEGPSADYETQDKRFLKQYVKVAERSGEKEKA